MLRIQSLSGKEGKLSGWEDITFNCVLGLDAANSVTFWEGRKAFRVGGYYVRLRFGSSCCEFSHFLGRKESFQGGRISFQGERILRSLAFWAL